MPEQVTQYVSLSMEEFKKIQATLTEYYVLRNGICPECKCDCFELHYEFCTVGKVLNMKGDIHVSHTK